METEEKACMNSVNSSILFLGGYKNK